MSGIKGLADHLGISIGTVSRALNNKPDVNPKTRIKVLQAAKELGYMPDQAGRSLRKGTSNVIGFVLDTDSPSMMEGDLFFMRVFDGMQSVLLEKNLNLIALLSPPTEDPVTYLQRIVAGRFTDGLVLSSTRQNDPRIKYLAQNAHPFATLGRSDTDGGQPWLDLDFEGVVHDAVKRLVDMGHQSIALAVPQSDLNLRYVMENAYTEALANHGIPFDAKLLVPANIGVNGGVTLLHRLVAMSPRPTAIVFTDHVLPFGLYRGLSDVGMTPGQDLSVIGVGTRLASLMTPDLTHYRFNLYDLGQRMAHALLATMPAHATGVEQGLVREKIPFSLIEGHSIADLR